MSEARWQRATPEPVIQLGVGADLVAARAHDGTVFGWNFRGDPYPGFAKVRAWRIVVAQRSRRVLVEHEDSNSPWSIVDAASGEVARLARERRPMRVWSRAIAPDGRAAYALGVRDERHWVLATWNADSGAFVDERPVPGCPGYLSTVAVSPDGAHLIVVGKHGVHVWPLGGKLGAPVEIEGAEPGTLYEAYVQVLAVAGRTILVACSIYGVVHAFDVAAAALLVRLKRIRYGKYVVLVPSRRVFVFPSQAGLWAMSALDPAASAVIDAGATGDHCAAAFDGSVIAVASSTPGGGARPAERVGLYDAAALPAARALPVAAADESYRRLGTIAPAFAALLEEIAPPTRTSRSTTGSQARTRATKQPRTKPRPATRSSKSSRTKSSRTKSSRTKSTRTKSTAKTARTAKAATKSRTRTRHGR